MRVIDVLVGAAAATTKVGTARFDAMRRMFLKIDNLRFGELLLLARDFCGNELALDRERNKNGLAIFARNAFPAEGEVFDLEIDYSQESTLTAPAQRRIYFRLRIWVRRHHSINRGFEAFHFHRLD